MKPLRKPNYFNSPKEFTDFEIERFMLEDTEELEEVREDGDSRNKTDE